MANSTVLDSGGDSQKFTETFKGDPAMSAESDGGYAFSRPRFTKRAARIWTLGFTFVTTGTKDHILNFWGLRRGGSEIFQWTHPVSGLTHNVRFKKDTMPGAKYVGRGGYHRWDVDNVVLEES